MNIGSRLKKILDERNMTVSRLAREAEVSAQTIYAMIKRDSNKADMDIMARILEALDMDLMEFLELEPRRKRKAAGKPQAAREEQGSEAEQETISEERLRRREIEDYLL